MVVNRWRHRHHSWVQEQSNSGKCTVRREPPCLEQLSGRIPEFIHYSATTSRHLTSCNALPSE